MNTTAGVIRLDTLGQSDYWIDRHGSRHALTDMTQDYLGNVLSFLRRRALRLYELELLQRQLLLINPSDCAYDLSARPYDRDEAAEWLENSVLVTKIRAMLGEAGLQATPDNK